MNSVQLGRVSNSGKRFVIAGASGFIGSAIVRRATQLGYPAPIVVLRADSNAWRLAPWVSQCCVFREPDLAKQSVQDEIRAMSPASWLQIGWQGVQNKDRHNLQQVSVNIPLIIRSLDFATAVGCIHWVGFGSQAEYGRFEGAISEDLPVRADTVYGKAKLAAYWTSAAYAQAVGLTHCWLRIFSTYGPEDDPQWLIPYIISEIKKGEVPQLTKCEQIWDYLFVDDAADAALASVNFSLEGVYNIASGQGVVLRDIVKEVLVAMGGSHTVNFGGRSYSPNQVMHLVGDRSRLSSASGWAPKVSLREGIRSTVSYFSQCNRK